MQIKSIVTELCELKSKSRVDYIIDFLRNNNIEHNIQRFSGGTNVEVIKAGKNNDKEVLFFAHHDVFCDSLEGANDNTSSVAVLLMMTKFLYFFEPYYAVRIVFNDSEELLGAVFYFDGFEKSFDRIINNVGSYHYLKNFPSREKILGAFVLELSGIGDCIYFASKSGSIECNVELNNFLAVVANNSRLKFLNIPVSFTDIVAVDYFNLRGTVLGIIPFIEGENYLADIEKRGLSRDVYPHVWKKNHTGMDKYFSIQGKSLKMIYDFVIEIMKNMDQLSLITDV